MQSSSPSALVEAQLAEAVKCLTFIANMGYGGAPDIAMRKAARDSLAHIAAMQSSSSSALVEDDLRAAVIAAYKAGAMDVHRHWQEDRDPDFTEAAHDYAAATLSPTMETGK